MSVGKGVPGTGYRRVEMNPGKQLYRRPDGQVVEGSAGANEEYRLRQKGFVPVVDEPVEEAPVASDKGGKNAESRQDAFRVQRGRKSGS